ncbi:orotidine 5'-phosphate decarboxylase [Bacteroidetes bacterium UKL13-3]|nr:orotidine 5'-phosphate decarboxylase [Bacteroidetes bacterium UKL13-3]HCP94648.1 orotidine-5'-phosphate decarboxylase [Bacteroidota bacterium]
MNRAELINQIKQKASFLCVGLDTDINKIPAVLLSEPDPVFAFNKAIIDATQEYCVSYKINTAFYESMGNKGWETMEKTLAYLPQNQFSIADAKRGDIGNTSDMYARAFFETLSFDSVTLAPYMGQDSIEPFFKYENKWGIVLALTSNPGSADYEQQTIGTEKLYERVIKHTTTFTTESNLMFVVGATKAEELGNIRKHIPNHFLLVPGVGAQGGSLSEVAQYGMNTDCGLLVNASRSIIYASNGADFADKAAAEAKQMASEMKLLLAQYNVI